MSAYFVSPVTGRQAVSIEHDANSAEPEPLQHVPQRAAGEGVQRHHRRATRRDARRRRLEGGALFDTKRKTLQEIQQYTDVHLLKKQNLELQRTVSASDNAR